MLHLPRTTKLAKNEVHVWQANLQITNSQLAEFRSILSVDELVKSDRFKFELHRQRYIAARGWLRLLLASYLDIAPEDVCFAYGDRGKPEIPDQKLFFNLSHTEDLAVYGFSAEYLLGIDLEYVLKEVDCASIASRFFTSYEAEFLQDLAESSRKLAFFRLWTAKESYLKATGEGLVGGLDKIEVSIMPNGASAIKTISGDQEHAKEWFINCFSPRDNFVASLAIQNYEQTITTKQFSLNPWS